MISIILPITNSENLFDKCIPSILMQSHENFEILFIVNSSDSSSLSKLKNFENNDERIKIIVNDVSDEEHIMRNIGLKYASGDYILFLNSNTTLLNNSLEFFSDISINNSFDMLIFSKYFSDNTHNVLNHSDFVGENVFKILNNEYNVFYSKTFLDNVNISFLNNDFFERDNAFFLQTFFASNSFIFHKNIFSQNLD